MPTLRELKQISDQNYPVNDYNDWNGVLNVLKRAMRYSLQSDTPLARAMTPLGMFASPIRGAKPPTAEGMIVSTNPGYAVGRTFVGIGQLIKNYIKQNAETSKKISQGDDFMYNLKELGINAENPTEGMALAKAFLNSKIMDMKKESRFPLTRRYDRLIDHFGIPYEEEESFRWNAMPYWRIQPILTQFEKGDTNDIKKFIKKLRVQKQMEYDGGRPIEFRNNKYDKDWLIGTQDMLNSFDRNQYYSDLDEANSRKVIAKYFDRQPNPVRQLINDESAGTQWYIPDQPTTTHFNPARDVMWISPLVEDLYSGGQQRGNKFQTYNYHGEPVRFIEDKYHPVDYLDDESARNNRLIGELDKLKRGLKTSNTNQRRGLGLPYEGEKRQFASQVSFFEPKKEELELLNKYYPEVDHFEINDKVPFYIWEQTPFSNYEAYQDFDDKNEQIGTNRKKWTNLNRTGEYFEGTGEDTVMNMATGKNMVVPYRWIYKIMDNNLDFQKNPLQRPFEKYRASASAEIGDGDNVVQKGIGNILNAVLKKTFKSHSQVPSVNYGRMYLYDYWGGAQYARALHYMDKYLTDKDNVGMIPGKHGYNSKDLSDALYSYMKFKIHEGSDMENAIIVSPDYAVIDPIDASNWRYKTDDRAVQKALEQIKKDVYGYGKFNRKSPDKRIEILFNDAGDATLKAYIRHVMAETNAIKDGGSLGSLYDGAYMFGVDEVGNELTRAFVDSARNANKQSDLKRNGNPWDEKDIPKISPNDRQRREIPLELLPDYDMQYKPKPHYFQ